MNAIVRNIVNLALRKYREPSTWVPIVAAIGTALHFNVSPSMQTAIDGVFAALVGVLFVAINEHGGGAVAGADSVRESAPSAAGNGSSAPSMPAGPGADIRPAATEQPRPVRRIGPDHGGD